mmetsp:Transcript_1234/g.2961  ORF Transcript_1234/g.2961 Transcript_1234/m.2961 type:complete len:205 (-) Transcript_1234:3974-4588(-)
MASCGMAKSKTSSSSSSSLSSPKIPATPVLLMPAESASMDGGISMMRLIVHERRGWPRLSTVPLLPADEGAPDDGKPWDDTQLSGRWNARSPWMLPPKLAVVVAGEISMFLEFLVLSFARAPSFTPDSSLLALSLVEQEESSSSPSLSLASSSSSSATVNVRLILYDRLLVPDGPFPPPVDTHTSGLPYARRLCARNVASSLRK